MRLTTQHGLPLELGLIQFTDFDTWRQEEFTPAELADPLTSGPGADPDGDALPNLHEYALRRDPHLADGPGGAFVLGFDGANLLASFQRDLSRADVALSFEQSPDLVTWSPLGANLGSTVLGIETWEASLPAAGPQQFVRLKAELAP